jgi:hypothetical protein
MKKMKVLNIMGAAVVLATTVFAGATTSSADELKRAECGTDLHWEALSSKESFAAIGDTQFNTNGGDLEQSATFTSTTTGTVEVSVTAAISGGVQAGIATIQQSVSATASASVSVESGNSTTVQTPPHSTIHGQYGAKTVVVSGHNVQYSGTCAVVSSEAADITAPTEVGWNVWVD